MMRIRTRSVGLVGGGLRPVTLNAGFWQSGVEDFLLESLDVKGGIGGVIGG